MTGKQIIYPAAPSRFSTRKFNDLIRFIRKHGHAPFNHRPGVSFDDFEENIGRARTLEFLIKAMFACDSLWVFGCSDGVMNEWKRMLDEKADGKNIRVFPEFDPDWEEHYKRLIPKYGDLFKRQREKQKLFLLVGPRAIGKTFWINKLIDRLGGVLSQAKTNTTRPARNEADHQSYNFMNMKEFEDNIRIGNFIEHDSYHGAYYGSTFSEIYKIFDRGQHGIIAITPKGSSAFFAQRKKLNLEIICLRPENDRIIPKNLDRRGILDSMERMTYINESSNFVPPEGVEYETVWISGETETDEQRIIKALNL